jgi:hypothetical protein
MPYRPWAATGVVITSSVFDGARVGLGRRGDDVVRVPKDDTVPQFDREARSIPTSAAVRIIQKENAIGRSKVTAHAFRW